MKQGVLPFQYEQEKSSPGMTAMAGMMTYLELMHAAGLRSSVERHVGLRECGQGWTDSQVVSSLILLNLAGGESVVDLDVLEKDAGLCRVLREVESYGMSRRERRAFGRAMACRASAEHAIGVGGVPVPGEIPQGGRGVQSGSSQSVHTFTQRSAGGSA